MKHELLERVNLVNNVESFITYWIEQNNVTYVPNSGWSLYFSPNPDINTKANYTHNQIVLECRKEYRKYLHETKIIARGARMSDGVKVSLNLIGDFTTDIEAALTRHEQAVDAKFHAEFREKIAYTQPNDLVASFLRIITKNNFDELDVIAVKQWLWQVKRKVFGKSHRFQQMLVFYGPQGVGKSKILSSLAASVFAQFTFSRSISEAFNPRNLLNLSQCYLMLFDELAGIDRVCINTMKDLITQEYYSPSRFYTQSLNQIPMTASFLATTNKHVTSIILDTSGMRRFYEIRIMERYKIEDILNFDWTSLFQGIDESNDDGFINGEIEQRFMAKSDSEQYKDDFEAFIEAYNIKPPITDADAVEVPRSQMFSEYLGFCNKNNFRFSKNSSVFGRNITSLGIESRRRDVDGKTKRFYVVSKEMVPLREALTIVFPEHKLTS